MADNEPQKMSLSSPMWGKAQPERVATVASPAPTSSVPPVRLKADIARGLEKIALAREATSA